MTKNDYLDRYFACTFMYKVYNKVYSDTTGTAEYIGVKLSNKTSEDDTTNKMYVDTSDDMEFDYFGNDWYLVSKNDIATELTEDFPDVRLIDAISSNFLINYKDKKFVIMTSYFKEL